MMNPQIEPAPEDGTRILLTWFFRFCTSRIGVFKNRFLLERRAP